MVSERSRTLVPMLIGIIASLSALLAGELLRENRCLEAGGRWSAADRACTLMDGAPAPLLAGPFAYLAMVPVGVVMAIVLWRTFSFYATGRAVKRVPRS